MDTTRNTVNYEILPRLKNVPTQVNLLLYQGKNMGDLSI